LAALGIARGALDYAVGYVKERKQFGRAIAHFQGLQFMLAMSVTTDAVQLLGGYGYARPTNRAARYRAARSAGSDRGQALRLHDR
jgi:alkylation response protein AidB-like acyl-CoA dehydrogenase